MIRGEFGWRTRAIGHAVGKAVRFTVNIPKLLVSGIVVIPIALGVLMWFAGSLFVAVVCVSLLILPGQEPEVLVSKNSPDGNWSVQLTGTSPVVATLSNRDGVVVAKQNLISVDTPEDVDSQYGTIVFKNDAVHIGRGQDGVLDDERQSYRFFLSRPPR